MPGPAVWPIGAVPPRPSCLAGGTRLDRDGQRRADQLDQTTASLREHQLARGAISRRALAPPRALSARQVCHPPRSASGNLALSAAACMPSTPRRRDRTGPPSPGTPEACFVRARRFCRRRLARRAWTWSTTCCPPPSAIGCRNSARPVLGPRMSTARLAEAFASTRPVSSPLSVCVFGWDANAWGRFNLLTAAVRAADSAYLYLPLPSGTSESVQQCLARSVRNRVRGRTHRLRRQQLRIHARGARRPARRRRSRRNGHRPARTRVAHGGRHGRYRGC